MADSPAHDARPIAEISHGPSALEAFLENNQKKLIVAGVVIALATGSWVVMQGLKEGADQDAGAALVAAEDAAALESVASIHADSPAAASAGVLLSDRQWDDGEQDAAIATLRAEIAAHPDHPASIPARARLGARLAAQGKNDEARAEFEALIAQPGANYLAPYALTAIAEIAKVQGDLTTAEELLTRASEEYAGNQLSQNAAQAERFLRFEMPEPIDPPAPEAAPAPDADPTATEDAGLSAPPESLTDLPQTGTGNPLLDSMGLEPVDEDAPDSAPAEDSPSNEDSADSTPAEESAPLNGESN